jgi:hypothetical protein
MHVIYYAAHALRQFDGGASPGDIGAEAGNDRQAASRQEACSFRDRGIERG